MNKAFEKILDRLEEERKLSYADFSRYVDEVSPCLDAEYDDFFHRGLERASRLVKEAVEEYNNGWIACSERLPNVSRCRVTVKYDMEVGNPVYDTLDADFYRYQGGYVFKDNCLNDITNSVVAWMPLPEPYKGE